MAARKSTKKSATKAAVKKEVVETPVVEETVVEETPVVEETAVEETQDEDPITEDTDLTDGPEVATPVDEEVKTEEDITEDTTTETGAPNEKTEEPAPAVVQKGVPSRMNKIKKMRLKGAKYARLASQMSNRTVDDADIAEAMKFNDYAAIDKAYF